MIALIDDYSKRAFRKFDPLTRMMISRDTGVLNPLFKIEKSQMIDLYYFCTMD